MKLILLCLALFILPISVAAQEAVPHDEQEMHRLHSNPEAYIGALEDPKRGTGPKGVKRAPKGSSLLLIVTTLL
jgi:hypothetical protein